MMKLLVLILAVPLSAVQAQVPSPAPATNEPTTGTISGKVVNENGQPMPGASAFVRSATPGSVAGRTTLTDAEGNFQVSGLDPGLYTVGAGAPAYTSIPADPNTPTTYYRIGDSVRVELVRGGVITGTVMNALGEPVIAVRVRAIMIRDAKGQPRRLPTFGGGGEQMTDDRGVYRIYGLAPGTYVVNAGGLGVAQSFQFNPYESDVPTYAPSATRDNAAEVSVRAGEETTADIRYRGDAGYTVSGTVKLAGSNGTSIMLIAAGGGAMGNTFQPANSRGFAFHGVGDGDYDVVAQAVIPTQTNSATPMMSVSESRRITVKGASVTGIELVPQPLGSISGRISLEPSKVQECQGKRPPLFTEMIIQVRRPEKDPENTPYVRLFASAGMPDQNGAFVMRNVSPGKYQFDPRFYARYWYLQSMTTGTAPSKTDAAANWTTMKFSEQLTNLNITLAAGAASIRGKLASEEPPSGMVLYLVPAEPDKAENVLRFFVTEIAADGTFALSNLPPGKYWALAQPNTEPQTATLTKIREPEAATSRTKLRKTAEAQKTQIELKPCQNLTDYQLKQ